MPLGDEGETGETPSPQSAAPASETVESVRTRPVESNSPAPIFHPLAYRGVVAEWPIEWRERWGHRANALEDSGLSWRDAETQAFVEVWNLRRQAQASPSPADALVSSSAERN
jgi:hypothetical protein